MLRYETVLADPQWNRIRPIAEFVVELHDVLQSFGFLDLDPAGVQQLQGIYYMGNNRDLVIFTPRVPNLWVSWYHGV